MELIDTHTHLYVKQFDEDRSEVISRAVEMGVQRFYLPNIDSDSIPAMLELEGQFPARCIPMMGLHPCSVGANYKTELAIVKEWLARRPFAAVGEIGMDLYWDKTFREQQEEAFLLQSEWAIDYGLPIVIHSRETTAILIDLIRQINDKRLGGIFHCFTGTVDQGLAIIEMGFKLGIGGVATFKNGGLDKTLERIPLEALVLETDSPYLAPKPHRGKRNESGYLGLIAQKLSFIYDVPVAEVAEITTRNAMAIFGHYDEKKGEGTD